MRTLPGSEMSGTIRPCPTYPAERRYATRILPAWSIEFIVKRCYS
jgi:hypothetical protein